MVPGQPTHSPPDWTTTGATAVTSPPAEDWRENCPLEGSRFSTKGRRLLTTIKLGKERKEIWCNLVSAAEKQQQSDHKSNSNKNSSTKINSNSSSSNNNNISHTKINRNSNSSSNKNNNSSSFGNKTYLEAVTALPFILLPEVPNGLEKKYAKDVFSISARVFFTQIPRAVARGRLN